MSRELLKKCLDEFYLIHDTAGIRSADICEEIEAELANGDIEKIFKSKYEPPCGWDEHQRLFFKHASYLAREQGSEEMKESVSNSIVKVIQYAKTYISVFNEMRQELAKPEQEPIGFISSKTIRNLKNGLAEKCIVFVEKNDSAVNSIYTSPPSREPLSFDDIESCFPDEQLYHIDDGDILINTQWLHDFARAIEKLRG